MATTFESLRSGYESMIAGMAVLPQYIKSVKALADRLSKDKARYQRVAAKIGKTPWELIAVLNNRENGGRFDCCLHNGEPIIGTGQKTRLVPAGRGPFATWEESAIDALMMPPHQFHLISNWTDARVAYEAERYNGFGYMNHPQWNENSPYVWGWTNVYDGHGKYVADGHYDPEAEEKQCGVMPLYFALKGSAPVAVPPPPDVEPIPAPIPQPKQQSWVSMLLTLILSIFRRK